MIYSTESFNLILLIIASGVLGYEIVYSELSYRVKRFLFLNEEQPVVQLLAAPKAHWKLFKWWLAFPPVAVFSIITIIIALGHRFLFKLLQCPFCTSFWAGLIAGGLLYTVQTGLVIGFCSMFMCSVYNLIRMKSL